MTDKPPFGYALDNIKGVPLTGYECTLKNFVRDVVQAATALFAYHFEEHGIFIADLVYVVVAAFVAITRGKVNVESIMAWVGRERWKICYIITFFYAPPSCTSCQHTFSQRSSMSASDNGLHSLTIPTRNAHANIDLVPLKTPTDRTPAEKVYKIHECS